ncbi:gamma-glutamyltransferase [Actinoplanes sp. NPDC020271]|uniref:gamma-glutamyltransferase n=1 Tax=Actinoplanes sp. NPDC020271 TaxID=3363896 RepID=UPI0037AE557C
MRFLTALTALSLTTLGLATPASATPATPSPPKTPTAEGYGGAVATVDATATAAGLDVLRRGGNAVDAAVAAAATLGVTEPFASGIGGGGFFVYYDARTHRVHTIDGRETGPATMTSTYFVNPATGQPYAFDEARVSGLSVGVPGTLATWEAASKQWGTRPLSSALTKAAEVADRGYTVDGEFRRQVTENAAAFGQFDATKALYLPGGAPPAVGTTIRNPDLARTYRLIARNGTGAFYRGEIGRDLLATVQDPEVSASPTSPWAYPIRPGALTARDLASYQVRHPAPTKADYKGLTVYGMSTPSSGGTTVSEALNILEASPLGTASTVEKLHYYLEASALAFADRGRYIGADTPKSTLRQLLSDSWAKQRACQISPDKALVKPVAPGPSGCTPAVTAAAPDNGMSTTNLTVADKWGNVVEYTLTLEQFGGNGMVVPGRGFMLNNELTDFNFTGTQGTSPDPNLPGPGKRPRSSMSPTIILEDGKPFLAVGAPGGSTIITTVLQIIYGRLDLGLTLPQALAAPRAAQRNTAGIQAEPAFHTTYGPTLTGLGHVFGADAPEIGAATAIEFTRHGGQLAVAEPVRRGGGAAAVVRPRS